ncbi:MAG: prohibitin family protein [Deltaproteobacteria bacterium]|nr:prohibitin family protein [Deltaproteobacteria bacterium]
MQLEGFKKIVSGVGRLLFVDLLPRMKAWLGARRGKLLLAVALGSLVAGLAHFRPVTLIAPGEAAMRINRLNGDAVSLREGIALEIPYVHEIRRYPMRDQTYRPELSARANGSEPLQSAEGLSLGLDLTVRYGLEPGRVALLARTLPDDVGRDVVGPKVAEVLHRTVAKYTVREIFSTKRAEIQSTMEEELRGALAQDGVLVKAVLIGNVDLPAAYRAGLEGMLAEELAAEKMRYTLELKEKQVQETALEGEAEKVRREKAAEAAGQEEILAARAKGEAMKHILPSKEKEIEQRRLEAEAFKAQRVKQAEAEAEAHLIGSQAEADARRKLADADAYRIEATGKASSEQLAREGDLISRNPLLIQKTMADKLSDKIQVIIAPTSSSGFVAASLLGGNGAFAHSRPASPSSEELAQAAGENEGEAP